MDNARHTPQEIKEAKRADKAAIEAWAASFYGSFDEAAYKRGAAKAARWMKAAYGSADWAEYAAECGDSSGFYSESLTKVAPGEATFNRTSINGGGVGLKSRRA